MTLVHLHLALCHVPVVGQFFVCVGLLIAVFRKDLAFSRWILAFAVFVGLSALPVTWSGEESEDVVEKIPGISSVIFMDTIEAHEEAAETALALALAAAGVASLAFVATFLRPGAARAMTALTLLVSLTAAGFMGYAANLGGQIRHSEIRAEVTPK